MEKLIKNKNGQWKIVSQNSILRKGWEKGVRTSATHPIFNIHANLAQMLDEGKPHHVVEKYIKDNAEHITPHSVELLNMSPKERDKHTVHLQDIKDAANPNTGKFDAKKVFGGVFSEHHALGRLTREVAHNMHPNSYANVVLGPSIENANISSPFREYMEDYKPSPEQHIAVLNKLTNWHKNGDFIKYWGPGGEDLFGSAQDHVMGHHEDHLELRQHPGVKAATDRLNSAIKPADSNTEGRVLN
jgi:hypothetical protein